MLQKFQTLIWFLKRPSFYRHAIELGIRKLRIDKDSSSFVIEATNWAEKNTLSIPNALKKIGLINHDDEVPFLDKKLIEEASALADLSKIKMGGPGDIDLIFAAMVLSKSEKVIESGVAFGWSSLAILAALQEKSSNILVSVDMPYPKMNNEDFVGIAIPDRFQRNWTLLRQPDRCGIKKALKILNNNVDLCHYDSDKSYYGRVYGYPLFWDALNDGGIFISDDIQDNLAFKEFVELKNVNFAVTKHNEKYIGIIKK
jgi:predicted O-methyltransferase YrrM